MPDGGPGTTEVVDTVTEVTGIPPRVRGAVGAIMLGLFLAAMDQSLFATALPTIAGELGSDASLYWVNTVTVLGGVAVMPVLGRVGDEIGRPRVFIAALTVLLVGSVLGGFAPNLPSLLAARALQGVGGGGMLVLVEAMVADLVPTRRRTSALSVVGAVFAVAAVSGPVLGGWLTQSVGWRWAFWVNVPVAGVAITAAWFLLPHLPRGGRPWRRGRLPVASVALLVVTVSSLTLVTAELGGGGARVPSLAGAGLLTLAAGYAFYRVDRRADAPLLTTDLFRHRNYTLAVLAGLALAAALFGTVAYPPTHLQMGAGLSPAQAGLLMLCMVAGLGGATVVAGLVVARTESYRGLSVLGAALGAVALGLLSTMRPDSSLVLVGVALGLLGVGIGCAWEVLVVVAQSTVSPDRVGVATAGNGFIRELGVLVGTAGVGAAYSAGVMAALADPNGQGGQLGAVGPVGVAGWTPGTLTPHVLASLPPSVADTVRLADTEAFTPVLRALVPLAMLAAVLLLFLRRVRETSQRDEGAER